jgi:PAS domain S-box-containing protein
LEKITETLSSIREGVVESFEVDESKDEIGQLSQFIHDMGKSISSRMNELIDLEEHTRFALQSAGAGAWRWDMINKNLHWSAKNFQLLGYIPNKNKASIRLWRSLVHPDDAQRVDYAVSQLLNEHKDLDVEYRIIRHSGEVRWMRSVGRMYFDHEEKPTEAYGLQIDISRYKNTEYDLWGQIFLLKKMLTVSGECIVTIGAKQEILLCNAATLFLFGYGKGELFGRPFYHLVSEAERESMREMLNRDLNSSDQLEHRSVVFTGLSKTGQSLPLQMKFEKYLDEEKYQRTTLLITSAAAEISHVIRNQQL